jgi:hypothetical protein
MNLKIRNMEIKRKRLRTVSRAQKICGTSSSEAAICIMKISRRKRAKWQSKYLKK